MVECTLQMESICHLQFLCVPVPCPHFCLPPGSQEGAGLCSDGAPPAALGAEGGHLAKRSCLSCQKHRGENNNKVFLALEENYRKEAAKKIFRESKRITKVSILGVQFLAINLRPGKKKKKKQGKNLSQDNNYSDHLYACLAHGMYFLPSLHHIDC